MKLEQILEEERKKLPKTKSYLKLQTKSREVEKLYPEKLETRTKELMQNHNDIESMSVKVEVLKELIPKVEKASPISQDFLDNIFCEGLMPENEKLAQNVVEAKNYCTQGLDQLNHNTTKIFELTQNEIEASVKKKNICDVQQKATKMFELAGFYETLVRLGASPDENIEHFIGKKQDREELTIQLDSLLNMYCSANNDLHKIKNVMHEQCHPESGSFYQKSKNAEFYLGLVYCRQVFEESRHLRKQHVKTLQQLNDYLSGNTDLEPNMKKLGKLAQNFPVMFKNQYNKAKKVLYQKSSFRRDLEKSEETLDKYEKNNEDAIVQTRQENQPVQKQKNDRGEIADKTKGFNLRYHMDKLSCPSEEMRQLHWAMTGKRGHDTWEDLFEDCTRFLQQYNPRRKIEKDYISGMQEGLQKAIDNPCPDFPAHRASELLNLSQSKTGYKK